MALNSCARVLSRLRSLCLPATGEAHRRAIGTKFPLPITIKAPPRRTWSCLPLRANRTRSDAGGFNCNGYREHRTYCSSVCFPVAGRPIPRKHLVTLWISSIDIGCSRDWQYRKESRRPLVVVVIRWFTILVIAIIIMIIMIILWRWWWW